MLRKEMLHMKFLVLELKCYETLKQTFTPPILQNHIITEPYNQNPKGLFCYLFRRLYWVCMAMCSRGLHGWPLVRGGGEKWKGRSGREELLWTDHNPYSPSLCTAWGEEEVEELQMK